MLVQFIIESTFDTIEFELTIFDFKKILKNRVLKKKPVMLDFYNFNF